MKRKDVEARLAETFTRLTSQERSIVYQYAEALTNAELPDSDLFEPSEVYKRVYDHARQAALQMVSLKLQAAGEL